MNALFWVDEFCAKSAKPEEEFWVDEMKQAPVFELIPSKKNAFFDFLITSAFGHISCC